MTKATDWYEIELDKAYVRIEALERENTRLRDGLERICNYHNPFVTNSDADFMALIAKEALA